MCLKKIIQKWNFGKYIFNIEEARNPSALCFFKSHGILSTHELNLFFQIVF